MANRHEISSTEMQQYADGITDAEQLAISIVERREQLDGNIVTRIAEVESSPFGMVVFAEVAPIADEASMAEAEESAEDHEEQLADWEALTFDGHTADEYEQMARESRQRSADSWERSDTDGFLSQWASDTMARLYDLQAEALRDGGRVPVTMLQDASGQLVPARIIDTKWGTKWAVFANADDANSYNSNIVAWVGMGRKALAKRGYTMVRALVDGHWANRGKSITAVGPQPVGKLRFDPNAEVLGPIDH